MKRRSLLGYLGLAFAEVSCAPKIQVASAFSAAKQIIFVINNHSEVQAKSLFGAKYYILFNEDGELESVHRRYIHYQNGEQLLLDENPIYHNRGQGHQWLEDALLITEALRAIYRHCAQQKLAISSRRFNHLQLASHEVGLSDESPIELGAAFPNRTIRNVRIIINPNFPDMTRPSPRLFRNASPPRWLNENLLSHPR